jgi:hypothetical protein
MSQQAIGIDIGGTHTKLAIVSKRDEIQHLESFPTAAREDPQDYLDSLVQRIDRLIHDNKISGIGLAAPGFLSKDRRSIKKIAAGTVVFPKGHGTMQATGEGAPDPNCRQARCTRMARTGCFLSVVQIRFGLEGSKRQS